MIRTLTRYFLTVLTFWAVHINAYSQSVSDFEIRQEVGLIWQPSKKLQVNPLYRLNTFDNASRFKRSMFSLSAEYQLKKWISVGGEYRYYMSYVKDYHRFLAQVRFSYAIDKFTIRNRIRYQQEQDYFDREYLAYHNPQRVFRNKLSLNYTWSRKLSFYVYADAFVEMKHAELNWYRVRYGAGGSYIYKRQHEIGAEVFLNDEFQVIDPENTFTLKLKYNYYLTKMKKKKKKNKSQGAADSGGN